MSRSAEHEGLSRREWLATAAATAVVVGCATSRLGRAAAPPPPAPLVLAPLPYEAGALAPWMSAETLLTHHGKHHQAYVSHTNTLIAGTPLAGKSLATIVQMTAHQADKEAIYNNAAQALNHAFFWQCLTPHGGGIVGGALGKRLAADFGSVEAFGSAFTAAAMGQFGSGWIWLVEEGAKLKVIKTANADTPVATGQKPLLTLDVWEHAYYLDYKNRRADYVKAFLEHLVAWDFVAHLLDAKTNTQADPKAGGPV